MQIFPDYPRDSKGQIPEDRCFDVIRIWPEMGGAYLWDMNGTCCTVGCITGNDHDPCDDAFMAWQDIYECKPLTENADTQWESDQERKSFERQGLELAQRLFHFLNHKRTVIYYDLDRTPTRFNALGNPPIRLSDEDPVVGDTIASKRLGRSDGKQGGQGKP